MSSKSKPEVDAYEETVMDTLKLVLWYVLLGALIYFFGWIIGTVVYMMFY